MYRLLMTLIAMGVLAMQAQSAPAPKEAPPEPAGPITPAQLMKSANNLKQIAIAFHAYNDSFTTLPTNQLSKEKKPLLSWRVQILPFIEQDTLYKQFKLDEPWDSENNKKLIDKIPAIYAPIRVKADAGMTFYQTFSGSNGWMKPGARIPASFPDGTSNTFLVAEAAKPVIWTKPDDMEFDGKTAPAMGGMFDGKFHAALGDGSVQRFRKDIAVDTLKLWIDPRDGNAMPSDLGLDRAEKK